MLASLSAILAPVVIGTFLPTTQLKIDDQKMYVRVPCVSDLQCPGMQSYVDQGYTCMQPNNNKSLCVKTVASPILTQDLIEQAVTPWQGSQLKTYDTLKAPELIFNSGFYQQWKVTQKAWLHLGETNQDYFVYETSLSKNSDAVGLTIYFDPDSEDLDMILALDPNGKDLWRPESIQTGSGDQFVKSNVRLRWQRVEEAK
jgi:hypothetical protein